MPRYGLLWVLLLIISCFSFPIKPVPELDVLDHIEKTENDVWIAHVVQIVIHYFRNIPEAPLAVGSKLGQEVIILNGFSRVVLDAVLPVHIKIKQWNIDNCLIITGFTFEDIDVGIK